MIESVASIWQQQEQQHKKLDELAQELNNIATNIISLSPKETIVNITIM